MKRTTALLAITILAVVTNPSIGDEGHKAGHTAGAKMNMTGVRKTLTGEIVDLGCYLGHAARGPKHISCATKCINQGMPMGLLTSGGTLYLVTLNHDDADPYNQLKSMAGKSVTVTGTVMTRSGMTAIDVSEVKAATAAAGK